MRRDAAREPNNHKPERAPEVEKEKVPDQICRIIYEHLDKEGHWHFVSDGGLYEFLLDSGAVATRVIRGRDNQLNHIEEAFLSLEEAGRVFFRESDGVCELSPAEKWRQHLAATARRREEEARNANRYARRQQEREAQAT